ncbi:MAG: hypothetical protein H8D61_02410 [Deltaproteobacteria bacterium]|nr:hypothetical protein [Deltaproteobacteria bacterium]
MTTVQLKDDHKIQILLIELQERYAASHKMRERSTRFTIWLSGMAVGLAWMLISHKTLVLSQRLALTLLISTLWTGAGFFILGLRKGFQSNRRAMIKSERALGMYETGIYFKEESLLPTAYKRINSKWNDHFPTLCIWLCIVAFSLLVLAWTCPDQAKTGIAPNKKVEQIKGDKKNG